MAYQPRSFPPATILKTFGIATAVCLLVFMVLYVVYAGGRRKARGQGPRSANLRARRPRDAETGAAGTARRNCRHVDSVDTLPRYTPKEEGGVAPAPPEQVHGSGHDGVEEEGPKPPAYTFDAGGPVSEGEFGEAGEGHAGLPVSPDPVHISG